MLHVNYTHFPEEAPPVFPPDSRIAYFGLPFRANPDPGTCLFGQKLNSPQFWQCPRYRADQRGHKDLLIFLVKERNWEGGREEGAFLVVVVVSSTC